MNPLVVEVKCYVSEHIHLHIFVGVVRGCSFYQILHCSVGGWGGCGGRLFQGPPRCFLPSLYMWGVGGGDGWKVALGF